MNVAALLAWVLTAAGGAIMLAIWLLGGGLRHRHDGGTRFQPRLIFGHAGLAAFGLALWFAYVIADAVALAWLAVIVLLPVVGLGASMLAKWLGGRASERRDEQPEQRFPSLIVTVHGVAAVATVALVLVAAIVGT